MRVTLLGSGEALGMPAPLCGCNYCRESERRRRPSVLIETDEACVALDAGPDLKEQLHKGGVTDVDAFFITHHHFDHMGGLHELDHAAMAFTEHMLNPDAFAPDERPHDAEFVVYLSERCLELLTEQTPHLTDRLDLQTVKHGESVAVGDLRVIPFPVDHARPTFDTLGFAVSHDGSKVVYAPDMWKFMPDREAGDEYTDADVLFVEGAALFRTESHGTEDDLRMSLADANADRTVLVNLSEHLQQMTTAELRDAARADDYELGSDFTTYNI